MVRKARKLCGKNRPIHFRDQSLPAPKFTNAQHYPLTHKRETVIELYEKFHLSEDKQHFGNLFLGEYQPMSDP